MRCLFCKQFSESSRSVEHIIPSSLGNVDHILPAGWVCDACNNYLSREVEAPFLNSEYCKRARFEMAIPNRRGRIPVVDAYHPQTRSVIKLTKEDGSLCLCADDKNNESKFIAAFHSKNIGPLFVPSSGDPLLTYAAARFIGKIALEAFAYRCVDADGWNDELVDKQELDELRDYVRRGRPNFVWPVYVRRIYPANKDFSDYINPSFEVLHEFDFLFVPSSEMPDAGEYYAVIAIFGVEYVINLGGPELDGYLRWLQAHEDQSYLY